MISTDQIKQLRDKTGISITECKKALEKAGGNESQALKILGQRGQKLAVKKSEREAKQGLIEAYVHSHGKIGALLELNCESDFAAKNAQTKELAHSLAMQITAMAPQNLDELLSQPFIKNPTQTVQEVVEEYIAKLGENIKIGKFVRYEL